jgi:hypothetical protein
MVKKRHLSNSSISYITYESKSVSNDAGYLENQSVYCKRIGKLKNKTRGQIFVGLEIDGPVWLKRLKKKPASKQGLKGVRTENSREDHQQ